MTPYANDAINQIYEMLFCDNIDLYRNAKSAGVLNPRWSRFDDDPEIDELLEIIGDPAVETRAKIFAAKFLSARSRNLDGVRLFSVIVEVGMDEGLDVLAVFEDGSARYINHSEKLIVWDTETTESKDLVEGLFLAARNVVEQIGPWEGPRLPPPPVGIVRMSFIVSDGLYFGEGPFADLANDPIGGPVINVAFKLMEYLVENTLAQSA